MYIYRPIGIEGSIFAYDLGDRGSIQSRGLLKTQKFY